MPTSDHNLYQYLYFWVTFQLIFATKWPDRRLLLNNIFIPLSFLCLINVDCIIYYSHVPPIMMPGFFSFPSTMSIYYTSPTTYNYKPMNMCKQTPLWPNNNFDKHCTQLSLPVQVMDVHGLKWDVHLHMAVIFIPILFTTWVRNLKYMVPISSLANFLMVVGYVCTIYIMSTDLPPVTQEGPVKYVASWNTLPLFFGTVVYSFEGISLVSSSST